MNAKLRILRVGKTESEFPRNPRLHRVLAVFLRTSVIG